MLPEYDRTLVLYICEKNILFCLVILFYYRVIKGKIFWFGSILSCSESIIVIIVTITAIFFIQRITFQDLYCKERISLIIIILNISTGMIEELLFRGVLFDYFFKQKRIIVAFAFSSILFGMVHMLNIILGGPFDPILIINLCILGFLFAIVYFSYGLISAILFHGIWNSVFYFINVEEKLITGIFLIVFSVLLLWKNWNKISRK